jgi:TonB-linked SusC/RagA family outer membrane protein
MVHANSTVLMKQSSESCVFFKKIRMRKFTLFSLGLLLFSLQLFAQTRVITGRITDERGNGIAGASVVGKGTSNGTQTSADGSFELTLPASTRTIIVSYVGLAEQEIELTNTASYDVTLLAATATNMDEVVVVAYGQQLRRAVTGAISTVSADKIERQQVVSVTQALQGLASGVLVINTTGQPGDNPTIRIRGIGSVNASADPLVVLDGTPFNGNLNTLNPNDIENMTVLKDATATALYGSRAANGVILITTKQGKRGRAAEINFYSSYGTSSRAIDEYPYVSAAEYMRLAWEAQRNTAISAGITNPGQYATNNLITGTNGLRYNPYGIPNPIDTNGNLVPGAELLWETDWNKELQQDPSLRKNIGVNIGGGSDKIRYFLSADYLQQNGYVIHSNFERITARLNMDAEVRSWLTTGVNMSVSSSTQNYPTQTGGSARNATSFPRGISSIYPLYMRDEQGNLLLDANGKPQFDFGNAITGRTFNQNRPASPNFNAVAVQILDRIQNDRIQASMNTFGEIRFTDFLKFRSQIGVDRYTLSGLTYNNPLYGDAATASTRGRVARSRNLINSWTWNNMLNFQKSFGIHNVGAMVSSEAYDLKQENLAATRTNFPAPGIYEITAGATAEASSSSTNQNRLESYLGRATYNYDNRYFLEGTIRRDGSTRFAPENRWGTFFSVGGSWVISSEKFMQPLGFLNFLKLRASYGEVGNEGLPSFFPYLSLFSSGWNDLGNSGVVLGGIGNPDIRWEKLGTYNVGLDFSVFKDRLSGSVEYFNKNTFDLLFNRPLPPSGGFPNIDENIGSLKNSGIEVTLNSRNINKRNFTWETSLNFATLKNEITKLPQEKIVSGSFQLEVGRSLNEFFIYEWAGVNPQTGQPQWYKDEIINGEPTGKKLIVNNNSEATRYYFGSALPKVTGGFSNSFNYKMFDLSFLFNFALGGKVLDQDYIGLMHGFGFVGGQLHKDILNRWQKPGDETDVPHLLFKNYIYGSPSTRQLFSGDYARLRNLTIGVTLPPTVIQKLNVIKNLRFYVQADNYFTWVRDAKEGMDPELNLNGTSNQSSSPMKTFSVGLNVGF